MASRDYNDVACDSASPHVANPPPSSLLPDDVKAIEIRSWVGLQKTCNFRFTLDQYQVKIWLVPSQMIRVFGHLIKVETRLG
jgi:hypothetical protein